MGAYTPDAVAFAEGKPIELVTGEALLALVRSGQSAVASVGGRRGSRPEGGGAVRGQSYSSDPRVEVGSGEVSSRESLAEVIECPRCTAPMVQRRNRKSGEVFWGCSGFPACRGVRAG